MDKRIDEWIDGWTDKWMSGSLHGVLIRDPPVFSIDAIKFLLLATNVFARNLESTTYLYRMYVYRVRTQ